MEEIIRFPAIAIQKGKAFHVISAIEKSCSAKEWKKGQFENYWYFDFSGSLWPLKKARLQKEITSIDHLLNRKVDIELEFAQPLKNSTEKAKEHLAEIIENDSRGKYLLFVSKERLKEIFRKASLPGELILAANHLGADDHSS